jgi:hypothetical protein
VRARTTAAVCLITAEVSGPQFVANVVVVGGQKPLCAVAVTPRPLWRMGCLADQMGQQKSHIKDRIADMCHLPVDDPQIGPGALRWMTAAVWP